MSLELMPQDVSVGGAEDPVVAQVRRAREAYAGRLGFDLQTIYHDMKRQEQAGGRPTVSLPPRRPQPERAHGPAGPGSRDAEVRFAETWTASAGPASTSRLP